MATYKNIRIKMKGGGSRTQRVKVLASGKYKFVKNLTKSRSKKTKTYKKTTRRKTKVARRKKRRAKRKFTIPLAPIIGLGVGLAGPVKDLIDGEPEYAVNKLKYSYLGLDTNNNFSVGALWSGLFPLIAGVLIHKFVGGAPLNVNRMLASANVPVIRI